MYRNFNEVGDRNFKEGVFVAEELVGTLFFIVLEKFHQNVETHTMGKENIFYKHSFGTEQSQPINTE